VTGPAWLLLPVLTPILVMLAALLLQRFETIVMNQADLKPAQESRITSPSVPQHGFDADSVTPSGAIATVSSRQPSPGSAVVAVVAETAVLVSAKIPSTEAILAR
jgi:hypothetical protein